MNNENQTQELTIVDTKEYGLEPVKANEMTSGLNSIIEERTALETIFNEVILKELNEGTLKEARSLRLNVRDNRTKGIEVWHKTNKAFYLAGGRFVDAVKNKEIAINERMESKLEEIENHFKVLEENRLTRLYADRVELLLPYGEVNKFIDLKSMDDVTFDNFLSDTKLAYETRRENERKAEEQRIADEKKAEEDRIKAEKEAEQERLKKQQEEKVERERIEKENAELKKQEEQRIEAGKQRIIKELAKVEKFAKMLIADGFELSNNDAYIPQDQHRWCKDEYSVSFGQLTLIESGDELKELINTTNNRISDRKKLEQEIVKERELQEQKNKRAKELATFINYIRDYDKLINSSESDFQKELDEMSKAFLLEQKHAADKLEEERKIQAEKDAEIKRLQEEKEAEKKRLQDAENERIAKEKALSNADDQTKVKEFFVKFDELIKSFPDLKSDPGVAMTKRVNEALVMVRKLIIKDSKTLL